MSYKANEIINTVHPVQVLGNRNFIVTKACIDSRQAAPGALFFAFKGDSNDGHDFIHHAISNGATCVIAEKLPPNIEQILISHKACIIIVKEVLSAMHQLASYARRTTQAKVICVTGSLGKTTTKELIADVLSRFFAVSASAGNKNNHIGMPLTLINSNRKSNIIVLEVAMNHSGEIEKLSKIARPDIAIITTIAPAHIENFQSMEEIADAKSEIFIGMDPETGIVILNQDNEYFSRLVQNAKNYGIKTILGLGVKDKSPIYLDNYKLSLSQSKYDLICKSVNGKEVIPCSIPSISHHAAYNTIFAFAIAKLLKLDLHEVQKIVAKFKGVEGRGNMETIMSGKRKITVINDCYNASPESVKSAITTLRSVKAENPNNRAICILGDMLELGRFSEHYHKQLASFIIGSNIDKVFAIGPEMRHMYDLLPDQLKGGYFLNAEVAKRTIRDSLEDNDIVLFKASRGMKLETVIEKLYQA